MLAQPLPLLAEAAEIDDARHAGRSRELVHRELVERRQEQHVLARRQDSRPGIGSGLKLDALQQRGA